MDGIYLGSGRFVSAEDAAELTRAMLASGPTFLDTRDWSQDESDDFAAQMADLWLRVREESGRGGTVYLAGIVGRLIR